MASKTLFTRTTFIEPFWKYALYSFRRGLIEININPHISNFRGFQPTTFTILYNGKIFKDFFNSPPWPTITAPLRIDPVGVSHPPFDPVWINIWHLTHSKCMPAFQCTTMWRTIARTWHTAEHCSSGYSGNQCPLCLESLSTTIHRYFTCPNVVPIWSYIYEILDTYPIIRPEEDLFFLQSNPDMPYSLRAIFFHTIIYVIHSQYIKAAQTKIITPIQFTISSIIP